MSQSERQAFAARPDRFLVIHRTVNEKKKTFSQFHNNPTVNFFVHPDYRVE